jgi:hypothetical protein
MGVHLLLTFFSHQVQLLHQRVIPMWLNLRPSCPDRPFFEELGAMEINTWIHKVLARGANLNPGAGPVPLREGVDKTRVSQLESVFLAICAILSSHYARILV